MFWYIFAAIPQISGGRKVNATSPKTTILLWSPLLTWLTKHTRTSSPPSAQLCMKPVQQCIMHIRYQHIMTPLCQNPSLAPKRTSCRKKKRRQNRTIPATHHHPYPVYHTKSYIVRIPGMYVYTTHGHFFPIVT